MKTKKFLLFILLLSISFLIPAGVVGIAYDQSLYQEALQNDRETTNPLAWMQTNDASMAVPASQNSILIPRSEGNLPIGSVGCTWYATLAMLIKADVWSPQNDGNITKFVQKCKDEGMFAGGICNVFDADNVSKYFPSVKLISKELLQSGGKTIAELSEKVKEAKNRGDFVVAWLRIGPDLAGGHAIFIDDVNEDGTLSVLDSCSAGDDLFSETSAFSSAFASCGVREKMQAPLVYGYFEYAVDGVDSRDVMPLWKRFGGTLTDDKGSNASKSRRESSEQRRQRAQLKAELDLIDWKPLNMKVSQISMSMDWYTKELSDAENKRVEAIQEDIKRDQFDPLEFSKKGLVFLGLILCIYSGAMIVADCIDLVNPLSDESLLTLITFKKYRIADKETIKEGDKKYRSRGHVYVYILFIMAVGIGLASGQLQRIAMQLLNLILMLLHIK